MPSSRLRTVSPGAWQRVAFERGQVILFSALMLPVLLGMTALAVDVGSYADAKRTLQNASDAIALAAGRDMCTPNPADCSNTTAALATANSYATKNGIPANAMTVTFLGGNTAPAVRVSITESHRFAFAPIIGINSKDVTAAATAAKLSPGALSGLMPWAITQATIDASTPGQLVTIKQGAGGGTTGNYGAIDYDGTGANVYRDTIMHGSQTTVCAQGQPGCDTTGCPGSFPSPCAENAPSCTGPQCTSEPGNMVGPTDQGVAYRVSLTNSGCNTFSSTFTLQNGVYSVNPACNPWGAGACPVPDDGVTLCSRRVVLIPIVDQFGNGRKPVTILGFAMFYLEGSSSGVVSGEFVRADVNVSGLAGAYNPSSLITFVRLVA